MKTIVRGDLLVVRTVPKDVDGNPVTPATIKLYLNYTHVDGAQRTDEPVTMTLQSGKYVAQFDTKDVASYYLFGAIRTTGPAGAQIFAYHVITNPANPPSE